MQRLVYSPSIKAWVKSDSGVIDLTPYITGCRIDRKVNTKSIAQLEFRNPKIMQGGKSRFLFTQHLKDDGTTGPLFHPMDPITIVFERIAGRPIQVFTGYCDAVPYVQLFPGLARLTASCTLKRLDYTYWDPALPFVTKFMQNYGWELGGNGQVNRGTGEATAADKHRQEVANDNVSKIIKSTDLNDSSIANLLYAVLNEIGGWDPSNIYIQPLPDNINDIVTKLFDEFTKNNKSEVDEVKKLLKDIVGNGSFGSSVAGGVSGDNSSGTYTGTVTIVGDSITDNSRSEITNAIPGIQIYAQQSKHMQQKVAGNTPGLDILRNKKNTLGSVVIVALGSNDEQASVFQFGGWIDNAMSIIGSNRTAIFVTVTNNDNINTAIRNKQLSHSNLKIADWKAVAELSSDGLHPTVHGQTVFAQTIATVVNSLAPVTTSSNAGTEVFETIRMASWIVPILKYARGKGWNGSINSGFRTFAEQTVLYNRYKNSGFDKQYFAAEPGKSNHEGSTWPRGAVDVDDHETLNRILLNSPYKDKLIWFGPDDSVHFSGNGH